MRDNDDLAGLWPGPAMARLASTLGASDVDLEAQHSAAGQVSAGGIDAAEVPLDLSLTHPSEKTSVSRAGTTNTANRLLSLPFPVQALIFAHCNHPTAISLRRTCQHFRQNFSVADTAAKTQAYRAELYARDANTYPAPCYTCLRLLPILHFDSKQPHHSRGELNSTCRLRTCIDCCLAGNRMTVGAHFWRRGVEYAKCIICGKIRPARPRVGRPVASWCGRCAEHQAIRRCIARWLKSNLFESVVCTLIECAPAFGLAVKLRETAAVGLKHDKTIYVWALYSCTGVILLNIGFLILVLLATIAIQNYTPPGFAPGPPATPLQRALRNFFWDRYKFANWLNLFGVSLTIWSVIHLFVSAGLVWTITDIATNAMLGNLLIMNVASIVVCWMRIVVDPLRKSA